MCEIVRVDITKANAWLVKDKYLTIINKLHITEMECRRILKYIMDKYKLNKLEAEIYIMNCHAENRIELIYVEKKKSRDENGYFVVSNLCEL